MFQEDALAGPGRSHDDERFPLRKGEIDAVEDHFAVEGLVEVLDADLGGFSGFGRRRLFHHSQKRSFVRKKSANSKDRLPETTARVVARPTPSAPPSV